MTELKTFVSMLNNADQEFTKRKSNNDWVVTTSNDVEFHFNSDESFRMCYNMRRQTK